MPIIVSRGGENATRLERKTIQQEDFLQRYIYSNPDSLPLNELRDGLRLGVVAREFPTKSGPIDVLGLDDLGAPYIIETKLYKNPDKRRVIAQVLDYGAALWREYGDPQDLIAAIDARLRRDRDRTLDEFIVDCFSVRDDEIDEILLSLRENIAEGRFRFVILMDVLDDRLRDLISYMNHNSKFDLFGVELDFYEYGGLEIIIPKLYGAEARKEIGGTPNRRAGRRDWTEDEFFADCALRLQEDAIVAVRELYEWVKTRADSLTWGTGMQTGSFNPRFSHISTRSVFTVWSSGHLQINFGWLREPGEAAYAQHLHNALSNIDGLPLPSESPLRHPSIPIDVWYTKLPEILEVFERVLLVGAPAGGEA
jgi:hypothetical protein